MSVKKKVYYANSHGQLLESHLIGVAIRAAQIFDAIGFIESKSNLRNQLIIASLFHDIGKLDKDFKEYIDRLVKNIKTDHDKYVDAELNRKGSASGSSFDKPFHNEVGWMLSRQILKNFSDLEKDNIGFTIYWHHPANLEKNGTFHFSNAKKIYENSSIKETSEIDINNFIVDLLDKANQIKFLKLIEIRSSINSQVDLTSSPESIEKPDFWQKYSDKPAEKKLLLFILIEADRWISSLSSDSLEDFIVNSSKNNLEFKNRNMQLKEISPNDVRSLNQLEVVKKISAIASPIAVCGVDPGEGKTRIGLNWWLQKKTNKLMVALPKQAQVTGLYKTILKDLKDIVVDPKDMKVVGFFNGVIQHDSKSEEEDKLTDIKILVFDRLLSPSYELSQVSEFIEMLFSDLILDEFHEFMFIPRMIDPIKDILTIRSWLKSTKTLLLSGTPEVPLLKSIGLNEFERILVSRESLKPHKSRLIELEYQSGPIDLKQIKLDSIVANLFVHDSQVNYKCHLENRGIDEEKPYLIHSSFTAEDRKNKLENILDEFSIGKGKGIVYSARLLQSSFDLNFKHGYIALSVPSVDIQFLGRINRYGDKDSEAKVIFFDDDKRLNYFYDNNFGFLDLKKIWSEFFKNKILNNKGRKWKYREIINEIYEEFWKKAEHFQIAQEYIERYRGEEEASLKEWFPVRYIKNRRKIRSQSFKKRTNSFREESYCASAIVVDDNGEKTSFLSDNDLLSVSGSWKVNKLINAIANKSAAALNRDSNDVFGFNKYDNSKKGLIKERPLFFSHPNENINHDLKTGALNESKLYRVYHKELGLCLPDLFPLKYIIEDGNFVSDNYSDENSYLGTSNNSYKNSDSNKSYSINYKVNKDVISPSESLDVLFSSDQSNIRKIGNNFRNYTQVDEKQVLVPLSRRVPIYYTEYCKVVRRGNDVRILADRIESEFTIPVASIGSLILGPGTSISAEAMRIATARGCKILVTGGEAAPLFLSSTQHRSPLSRLRQYRFVTDSEKRLKAGKVLFRFRSHFIEKYGNEILPKFPDTYWVDTIEKMLSVEGTWAKQSYKKLAQKYQIKWQSKQDANDKKHPIVFLNFLTYSMADIAILHLGYDPNVGVLHGRSKGGGLCYDLADVIKPVLALEGAFEAIHHSYNLKEIKDKFMSKVRELDVLDYLVETLNATFKEG